MTNKNPGCLICSLLIGSAIGELVTVPYHFIHRNELTFDVDGQRVTYSHNDYNSRSEMLIYQGKDLVEKIFAGENKQIYQDEVNIPNKLTYSKDGVTINGQFFPKDSKKDSLDSKFGTIADEKLKEAQQRFNRYYEQIIKIAEQKAKCEGVNPSSK